MADNIENHIINLQAKLQLLLKKHALLNKEIEQFRKENVDITSKIKSLHERNQQLEMQVAILKTSAGQLEGN
jgi:chromosome segregation ATPase